MPQSTGSSPAGLGDAMRGASKNLAAGRVPEAIAACEAMLALHPGHPGALHLLGVALTRQGRPVEALEVLQRACAAAPAHAAAHVALGNAWRKLGKRTEAAAAFESALALDPRNMPAMFNLAIGADEAGDSARAIELLGRVVRADPMDFEAAQMLVDKVAAAVRGERPGPAREQSSDAPALRSVTVGFCSVDDGRAQRARASLSAALGAVAAEFIVIRDAHSLAEAFNRILAAASGESVVLCHDDIEVLSSRLDLAIARALERFDIAGVAGSERVGGPAVLWTGHPHVHGWVSYPRGEAIEVAPLSFRSGLLGGMQALDGVFLAMRGSTARSLRFDDRTFDGFHFYDLDFTYGAHLAGHRLGVSTDILLLHASEGRFEESWKRYAERFQGKYPQLREPQGKPHWYGARVASREEALAFYERLRRLES